jgi:beta-galactosidase/beta-glucuronidase
VASSEEKLRVAKELLDFRIKHWDDLNMSFYNLYDVEGEVGDVTGVKRAAMLGNYEEGHQLRIYWYFTTDPKKELTRQEVWKQPFKNVYKWYALRLDSAWEQQNSNKNLPAKVRAELKNYNGVGWYALPLEVPAKWQGKEIALIFGAVDESAWVYLNGKFCGSQIYKGGDDWKKPFTIPITGQIDWKKKKQNLFVRVEDNGGLGGLWRPVILVCRDKK